MFRASFRHNPSSGLVSGLFPGLSAGLILGFLFAVGPSFSQVPAGYAGKAWHDTVQTLPGILLPKNYDDGASGITWFDTGPHIGAYTDRNSGVDLDPVHVGDPTVPGSTVKAVAGAIYWGWLENNEWLKMTVDVKQAGTYTINAMVGTAMDNTSFKVDALQGTDSVSSGTLVLPFTGTCPVECYHYWFFAKDLGKIELKAGIQVIRLQIVKSGYNIDYVDLEPANGTGINDRHGFHKTTGMAANPEAGKAAYDSKGRLLLHPLKAAPVWSRLR
jgi:hypothetical protein